MFSSNQIFIVTGDDDELLKEIISLLIRQMPQIVGYSILEDKMHIHVSTYNDRIKAIKKENAQNENYLFHLIKMYLNSCEYLEAKANSLPDRIYSESNGKICSGWKIEIERENKSNVISIRPYDSFYEK